MAPAVRNVGGSSEVGMAGHPSGDAVPDVEVAMRAPSSLIGLDGPTPGLPGLARLQAQCRRVRRPRVAVLPPARGVPFARADRDPVGGFHAGGRVISTTRIGPLVWSAPRTCTSACTTPARVSISCACSSSVCAAAPLRASSRPPGLSSGKDQVTSLSSEATALAVTTGASRLISSARPRCTVTLVRPRSAIADSSQVVRRRRGSTRCSCRSVGRSPGRDPAAQPRSRYPRLSNRTPPAARAGRS